MKKALALVLTLTLCLTLCACGTKGEAAPAAATEEAVPAETTEEAAPQYTETYVLKFATTDAAGGVWDELIYQPLESMLSEYSNGRISLEPYWGGSLAGQGSVFQSIEDGLCDIGCDVYTAYSGIYPYDGLYESAGIDFGSTASATMLRNDYFAEFPDDLDNFVLIGHYSSGLMGVLTKEPIRDVSGLKGAIIRCTGGFASYVDEMGASSTVIPMSEVYESLKLNAIDGATCTLSRVASAQFYEVAKNFVPFTWLNGMQAIMMSREVYDSMDPEAQAAVDRVCAEFQEVGINYVNEADARALETIKAACPDFNYVDDLTQEEIDSFVSPALVSLEDKAAEMDANGLRGTEALEWLQANCKKYYD